MLLINISSIRCCRRNPVEGALVVDAEGNAAKKEQCTSVRLNRNCETVNNIAMHFLLLNMRSLQRAFLMCYAPR